MKKSFVRSISNAGCSSNDGIGYKMYLNTCDTLVSSWSDVGTGRRQESDLKQVNGIRWSYTTEGIGS